MVKCNESGYFNGVVVSDDWVGGDNTAMGNLKLSQNKINNEQEERCQEKGGMQVWPSWSWRV